MSSMVSGTSSAQSLQLVAPVVCLRCPGGNSARRLKVLRKVPIRLWALVPSTGHSDQDNSVQPLPRGTEVGRFVLLGMVGRGGMGEVYAAHDPELDRKVAIKILRGKAGRSEGAAEGRARLIREAQAIAKVSHPNVVVVYDVGTFDGRVLIAMELVAGHTLGYWLQAQPRTLAEILEVFTGAGRGLGAAHEKELVHRDFKPENVMVGIDGQVRVMDFGLVRLAIDRDKPEGEPSS